MDDSVSAGAFDVVKDALKELGTVEFVRVAMQPGMPQGFGTLGVDGTPIFCLPGNPVSALVSFEVFVRPAVRLMLGKRRLVRRTVPAVSMRTISSSPGSTVAACFTERRTEATRSRRWAEPGPTCWPGWRSPTASS